MTARTVRGKLALVVGGALLLTKALLLTVLMLTGVAEVTVAGLLGVAAEVLIGSGILATEPHAIRAARGSSS